MYFYEDFSGSNNTGQSVSVSACPRLPGDRAPCRLEHIAESITAEDAKEAMKANGIDGLGGGQEGQETVTKAGLRRNCIAGNMAR
jgi:hypothetical protein